MVRRAQRQIPSWLMTACALLAVGCGSDDGSNDSPKKRGTTPHPGPGQAAWRDHQNGAVRGLTIGPIESSLHPSRGYGSERYQRGLREAKRMGATWVSLTPFARAWNLKPTGLDLTFEASFEDNRDAIRRAVHQAHAEGLSVMLVPHLWVETGEWRALVDPGTDAGWARWAQAYQQFVLSWAKVAEETNVDLLSVGVELRSWVTTTRAPS